MFMLGIEIGILEWYLQILVRKRGTDDGIIEKSNRSNFLKERERERERKKGRYEFCGGQRVEK